MDKETAQFKDVLEMYESFTNIEEVQQYTKMQLNNVKSQIKEPATSDQTEDR